MLILCQEIDTTIGSDEEQRRFWVDEQNHATLQARFAPPPYALSTSTDQQAVIWLVCSSHLRIEDDWKFKVTTHEVSQSPRGIHSFNHIIWGSTFFGHSTKIVLSFTNIIGLLDLDHESCWGLVSSRPIFVLPEMQLLTVCRHFNEALDQPSSSEWHWYDRNPCGENLHLIVGCNYCGWLSWHSVKIRSG